MISEIFSAESFLWSCLWQSTIFLVVGLSGSFLFRRHSARAHRVLFLAMMAAVIVPAASLLVKHYELGMFVAEPTAIQPQVDDQAIYESAGITSNEAIERGPAPINEDLHSAPAVSRAAKFPWRSALIYTWIAASLILTVRLLVTFVLGARLLGRALPLNSDKIEQAIHLAKAKLGISRDVKIYSSANINSPVIWCWMRRPVLLVPSTTGRLDNGIDWAGVLCHELAHYKRRDHVAGLLAELTVCFMPWHPLLWLAKSHLISLSEQACDDWVIASGQPGTDYAESLLNLTPGGQMAFVPAVVSSKKGLADRVSRILKDSCGNPRIGTKWILSAGIVTICIAMTVAFAQTRPANINNIEDEAPRNTLKIDMLPDGWSLDYDDGRLPGGGRRWPANMAENLLELKAIPTPANEYDESWKEERLELHLRSQQGEQISTISIKDDRTGNRIILAPGQYSLLYTRAKKDLDTSLFVQTESVEFPFDLSRPGMYELKFRPKLETSEAVESGTYPSAICTGTVIDSEGNPVNEADVAAYEMFFGRAGNINLRFVSEATTKSDGKLVFEITPSVKKNRSRGGIVVARKEGLALGWAHWLLYGNQEIKIMLQKPTRLSGEVIDENNKSIPNAEVRAVLFEKKSSQEDETRWLPGIKPLDWISVRTDRNGRFEFNNIPRNVRSGLLVSALGLGTIYSCKPDGQGGYESIMFEAGTTDIKITVSTEAIIEGKLIDEKTGAGIAGETLAVVPHFIPVFFERYLCTTQNDGTFNIGGLRSGKYVIRRVGQNSTQIDILAESGKTISDVIIKCPRDIQSTEAVSDIVFPNAKHVPVVVKPGSRETKAVQPEKISDYHQLPDSWSLDYKSSYSPDKIKNISANIGENLASLEVLPRPTDITDDSWKNEKFEFRIRSLDGARIGDILVRPKSEFNEMAHKIFQPGKYLLSYERAYGEPGKNYRIKSGAFLLDMSLPGMYELHFAPKPGNAEISGLAGGCYAVNFERTGSGFPIYGLAYINREKEYRLDGLSPGTYRLSAVTQQQSGNVLVSQAHVTIENETKVTVDIAPPPRGNCSLKGSIFGKQKQYLTPWPDTMPHTQGKWFILIRNPGCGIIKTTVAYEARTMDSLYVVRGNSITQDTKDKASYKIEGIVPGEYTVTAIEHPSWGGAVVTRQQSKPLTIRAGEQAVLDFDLRDITK